MALIVSSDLDEATVRLVRQPRQRGFPCFVATNYAFVASETVPTNVRRVNGAQLRILTAPVCGCRDLRDDIASSHKGAQTESSIGTPPLHPSPSCPEAKPRAP
jgi:hypothetical protein